MMPPEIQVSPSRQFGCNPLSRKQMQPAGDGPAGFHAHFFKNVLNVFRQRAGAGAQDAGYFWVLFTVADPAGYLQFALAQAKTVGLGGHQMPGGRAANYTFSYAEALILGRPEDQLVKPRASPRPGVSAETVARMEQEMVTLERDLKAIESGYGENMLHLTLARAYVRKLLKHPSVAGFLSAQHAEIHAESTSLAATESL